MKLHITTKVTLSEPREVTTSKGTTFNQYSGIIPGRTWNPKTQSWMNFRTIDFDEDVYTYLKQCESTHLSATRELEIDAGTGRISFAD